MQSGWGPGAITFCLHCPDNVQTELDTEMTDSAKKKWINKHILHVLDNCVVSVKELP